MKQLQDTTVGAAYPDDVLRRLMEHLVRAGGLLEPNPAPHEHGGLRVSMSEVFALGALADGGPLSQQDLAGRLGLEKSTVSRLVAGLVERGWVGRERDAGDRRFYRLTLTPAGDAAARRVGDDLRDHHGRLLSTLTETERQALVIGLGGLVRALEAHAHTHERLRH